MRTLHDIQGELHEWRCKNFPDADSTQQLIGMTEELGELAHAVLKEKQGIRGTVFEHHAEAKDAIGDLLIYTLGFCSYMGWEVQDILEKTQEHVMARDWIANPYDGSVPQTTQSAAAGSMCPQCGNMLQRTGTCHTCPSCGYNDGCG